MSVNGWQSHRVAIIAKSSYGPPLSVLVATCTAFGKLDSATSVRSWYSIVNVYTLFHIVRTSIHPSIAIRFESLSFTSNERGTFDRKLSTLSRNESDST